MVISCGLLTEPDQGFSRSVAVGYLIEYRTTCSGSRASFLSSSNNRRFELICLKESAIRGLGFVY